MFKRIFKHPAFLKQGYVEEIRKTNRITHLIYTKHYTDLTQLDNIVTMAPVYGWKGSQPQDGSKTVYVSSQGDKIAEDINTRLKKNFMLTLCRSPNEGVTEVN